MITAITEIEAFEAWADKIDLTEKSRDMLFMGWLAAKRHAAEVGEPTLEQQHEAAAAQFLASAPVEPVDALWGEPTTAKIAAVAPAAPSGASVEGDGGLTDKEIDAIAAEYMEPGDDDEDSYFDAIGFARAILKRGT